MFPNEFSCYFQVPYLSCNTYFLGTYCNPSLVHHAIIVSLMTRSAPRRNRRKLKRRRLLEFLEPRQLLASVTGEVWTDLNSNGVRDPTDVLTSNATVYVDLDQNGQRDAGEAFATTDSNGQYTINNVPAGTNTVRLDLDALQTQVAPGAFIGTRQASDGTGNSELFEISEQGDVFAVGLPQNDLITALVRTNSGALVGLNEATDTIFSIDPLTGQESELAISPVDLVGGLSYDAQNDLIFTLGADGGFSQLTRLHGIDAATGAVTQIGPGVTGLDDVSALSFDSVNGNLIAFDNADDEFVAIDAGGNEVSRTVATAAIDSDSLSFVDGQFILFDSADAAQTSLLSVDPATGAVTTAGFSASEGVAALSLDFTASGELPQRISVGPTDDITLPAFGIEDLEISVGIAPALGGLFINEVLISSLAGDDNTEQYVEIRGDAGALVGPNTYLAVVNDENASSGEIEVVIDLSNQQLGTGGFLALLQQDHPYQFDPSATVLESTEVGFGGLPGDIFSDNNAALDVLPTGAQTYFLIESSVPPLVGDDIDADGDGLIDVAISDQWQVFDSVSVHPSLGGSNQAYGDTVFIDDPSLAEVPETFVAPEDSSVVTFDGFGYVARVGDSVGSSENDWVAGTVEQTEVSTSLINIGPNNPVFPEAGIDTFETAQDLVGATYSLENNPLITNSTVNPHLTIVSLPSAGGIFEYFRFDIVTPTSNVILDIDTTSFDAALHLYDIDGNLLQSSDDDAEPGDTQDENPRIATELIAGTYVVGVAGAASVGEVGGITGDTIPVNGIYTLHLSVEPSLTPSINIAAFTGGTEGTPSQLAFNSRQLDHIGSSNFVGGVRGTVQMQAPPDAPAPAAGVVAFADSNNNGFIDNLANLVEPNDAVAGDVITNFYPGVTLSTAGDDNSVLDIEINSELQSENGTLNQVFAHGDTAYFNESNRFRADFYRPVNQVSIDAIANATLEPLFGVLEVYDAEDTLLQTVQSSPLAGVARQTLTIEIGFDTIAYAIAYSNESVVDGNGAAVNSSSEGQFDRFTFGQFEQATLTDENGFFELTHLLPNDYTVRYLNDPANDPLVGAQPVPILVETFENFVIGPNVAPVSNDLQIEIPENSAEGTAIGVVPGFDTGGPVVFSILNSESFGITIDSATGDLAVGPDAVLDFEATPEINLDISIVDVLGAVTVSTVEITLVDENETPLVSAVPISIPEDVEVGTAIGQVVASDPDTSQGQTLLFEIIGGTGVGTVEIDSTNGILSIADNSAIDFESSALINVEIQVTDNGSPSLFEVIDQQITILDSNDAPNIATSAVSVPEDDTGVVGRIVIFDQDSTQDHQFVILGGTGASVFNVTPSGSLILLPSAELDFETQSSLTLELIVFDSGSPPLSDRQEVTITVVDVDEPASLAVTAVDLLENAAPETLVSTLTLDDPEGRPQDSTVALLPSESADLFDFDPATLQLTVAAGADIDFETINSYELQFSVSDNNGQAATGIFDFQINVLDGNDAPSLVQERLAVSEATPPGAEIGTIRVSDPDVNQTVEVVIVGGTGLGVFELDPVTHVLTLGDQPLDAEALPEDHFTLDLRLTDEGGAVVVESTVVLINDVNEQPFFDTTQIAIPVGASGVPFLYTFPDDSIIDPENRQFELVVFDENGVLPSWLEWDPETRTLSGLPTPNEIGSSVLTIHAFELGPPNLFNSLSFDLTVEVGDTPFRNSFNPFDVDVNGVVTPRDVLLIINHLNSDGVGPVTTELNAFTGFVDVSGDGNVTGLDAVQTINALNAQLIEGELVGSALLRDDFDRDEAVDAALLEIGSNLF